MDPRTLLALMALLGGSAGCADAPEESTGDDPCPEDLPTTQTRTTNVSCPDDDGYEADETATRAGARPTGLGSEY